MNPRLTVDGPAAVVHGIETVATEHAANRFAQLVNAGLDADGERTIIAAVHPTPAHHAASAAARASRHTRGHLEAVAIRVENQF